MGHLVASTVRQALVERLTSTDLEDGSKNHSPITAMTSRRILVGNHEPGAHQADESQRSFSPMNSGIDGQMSIGIGRAWIFLR